MNDRRALDSSLLSISLSLSLLFSFSTLVLVVLEDDLDHSTTTSSYSRSPFTSMYTHLRRARPTHLDSNVAPHIVLFDTECPCNRLCQSVICRRKLSNSSIRHISGGPGRAHKHHYIWKLGPKRSNRCTTQWRIKELFYVIWLFRRVPGATFWLGPRGKSRGREW